MSAAVIVNRWTGSGGGPTKTNITTTTNRMAWSDSPADGATNPIPVPASGTNLSWWVSVGLAVGVTGPTTSINNIKFYSDGTSFGTGLACVANSATSYVQAVNSSGATISGKNGQTLNVTNYSSLFGAPVDVTTYTSGSPLSIGGSLGAGAINQDFGDLVVYQLQVGSTAALGAITARQFVFQWDEA